jgi:hypothetical protein
MITQKFKLANNYNFGLQYTFACSRISSAIASCTLEIFEISDAHFDLILGDFKVFFSIHLCFSLNSGNLPYLFGLPVYFDVFKSKLHNENFTLRWVKGLKIQL